MRRLRRIDGFEPNQKSQSGHTELYLAAAAGHVNIMRLIVECSADVNITGGRYTYTTPPSQDIPRLFRSYLKKVLK